MKRGEIWVGNLNPQRGTEVGKIRPVLIIQSDAITAIDTGTVIVLPLTKKEDPKPRLYRVPVTAREKLHRDSHVLIANPRTLDRNRIGEGPLATLTSEEMEHIERSFLVVLGMYR